VAKQDSCPHAVASVTIRPQELITIAIELASRHGEPFSVVLRGCCGQLLRRPPPKFGNPWHGSRVSFDRLSYRCFLWRLPIFGGRTPLRPRGMFDSVGYLSRKTCASNITIPALISSPEHLAFTTLRPVTWLLWRLNSPPILLGFTLDRRCCRILALDPVP
jgi:hypothetical protein